MGNGCNFLCTTRTCRWPKPSRSADHRRTLGIRFEAFNVQRPERTQLGTPNTNLNDPANFGLVRSQANAPQSMQFAAKFNR
jgi:hypothetical protein